jgi:hypothetical protein
MPEDCSTSEQNSFQSKGEWSRKQKRGYQRIRSLLWFWECHQFQVLWVMLSTAEGGDANKLSYRHKLLRQRVERQLGYRGIEHYQVRTEEGHGVLHIFWAWRAQPGTRARQFWVDQRWLSSQWEKLHGAPIVWVKAYRPGRRSRNRLSRYVISQYVQDQTGYVNMCWSWKRSLGFPLGGVWTLFKQAWRQRNGLRALNGQSALPFQIVMRTWENLLAGDPVWLGGCIVRLIVGEGLLYQEADELGGSHEAI